MAINRTGIDYSLYLVTDRSILGSRDFMTCIEDALAGGVTLVQLREKDLSGLEFYNAALSLKRLCCSHNVPLIINDRLDIMLAVDAEGLHIGQDDIPLNVARQIIGPKKILGYSVSTVEQALNGQKYANYLGAGVVFPTGSKSDAGDPIGVDALKAITAAVDIPVVAIGSIGINNLASVKATGADGISVISAILGQADIKNATQTLLRTWKEL